MTRGDLVLVRFPHPSGLRGKKRPAVIVQSDAYAGVITVELEGKSASRPRSGVVIWYGCTGIQPAERPMATKMRDLGIDRLSADERLELMHEIWESVAAEPGRTHLTAAQQRELERRLTEHEATPGDVVPWEEVKAQALARFQQQ